MLSRGLQSRLSSRKLKLTIIDNNEHLLTPTQIDSAAKYYNEAGCGNAIRSSGIPRDQIFFTSKVGDISYEKAKAQIDKTLSESKLDYIDLMLLHNPFGGSENRKGGWKAVSIEVFPLLL
jgi:diketogulonate reductase-like aldo/keto reductase